MLSDLFATHGTWIVVGLLIAGTPVWRSSKLPELGKGLRRRFPEGFQGRPEGHL